MPGDAGDAGYFGDALGRHLAPHSDGAALNAELRSQSGHQPTLRAEQVHAEELGHPATLSHSEPLRKTLMTKQSHGGCEKSLYLLRTADQLSCHILAMDIAQRIRRARTARNLTQRDLARLLGISPSAVAQWEIGATAPTVANRVDLARVLDVRLAELLPEGDSLPNDGYLEEDIRKLVGQVRQLDLPDREALLSLSAHLLERRTELRGGAQNVKRRAAAKSR